MQLSELYCSRIIQQNKHEFFSVYDNLSWITRERAVQVQNDRQKLIDFLRPNVTFGFTDTKLYYRGLSPGCQYCGDGLWSCLFINGKCNGNCFFCPTEQDFDDPPMTNFLTFPLPRDYLDYLEMFSLKGSSISGGEPFLTFSLTLEFVKAIRKHFGSKMYIWLYTNGILSTKEKLNRLKDAGVNEIRFNIAATNYDLSKVKEAIGVFDYVTVEIPAIPEHYDLLTRKIREMEFLGVNFLNLHQLRCTVHNCQHLMAREYTLLHGPKIGVLESEMTALTALKYVVENNVNLAVNYCSLIFRNRFQTLGSRKRAATVIRKPYEDMTKTGMIRTITVKGLSEYVDKLVDAFTLQGICSDLWYRDNGSDKMFVHGSLARFITSLRLSVDIAYYVATIRPAVSYRNPYRQIKLKHGNEIVVERNTVFSGIHLTHSAFRFFSSIFLEGEVAKEKQQKIYSHYLSSLETDECEKTDRAWSNIFECELLGEGLLEYF